MWHPTADAGNTVPSDTATKGGGTRYGHYSPRLKKTTHYTFSLASLEDVSKEPESKRHQPEGAGESEGSFELERVEHDTGGVFVAGGGNFGRARTVKTASARAGLLWLKTFSAELAAKGFEQCQTDPCMFRRTALESRRHHRGILRRRAGGE